jgi:hypothetical protein
MFDSYPVLATLKNLQEKMTSQYPKVFLKMNTYLNSLITYVEGSLHPAAVKSDPKKAKQRSSKSDRQFGTSPDCLNRRASARKQDTLRRNPAP